MLIFKQKQNLKPWVESLIKDGKTIAFVPTMGALHDGHISLIEQARNCYDIVVCSIFVNPAQFNDPADFEKYPITTEQDIRLLLKGKADLLFLPQVSEIYMPHETWPESYELGFLETVLEGFYRPGHFQGVCKVVHRLLEIVKPHALYLGKKDYQQCMVVAKLITDFHVPVQLILADTLRESSGLAMSSRNKRLSESDRVKAAVIYEILTYIRMHIAPGSLRQIKQYGFEKLIASGLKPEYIEISDATNLKPIDIWDGTQQLVCLLAAYLNEVRLIDNMVLN